MWWEFDKKQNVGNLFTAGKQVCKSKFLRFIPFLLIWRTSGHNTKTGITSTCILSVPFFSFLFMFGYFSPLRITNDQSIALFPPVDYVHHKRNFPEYLFFFAGILEFFRGKQDFIWQQLAWLKQAILILRLNKHKVCSLMGNKRIVFRKKEKHWKMNRKWCGNSSEF